MTINGSLFIGLFIPAVILLKRFLPKKYSTLLLAISNLIFLLFGGVGSTIIVLILSLIYYFAALLIDKSSKSKQVLIFAIILNIIVLFIFKYDYTFNEILFQNSKPFFTWLRPIGISFFTFQGISYISDVYLNKIPAEKRYINFFTFLTFFPTLSSGPILRFDNFSKQLALPSKETDVIFASSLIRVYSGFIKKMFFANQFAIVADRIFGYNINIISMPVAWIGALAYTFQIYFDFSGYSDIAIGLARILGFNIPENFNYPYIAKSITDFWRRWHISLSRWFRDYVYIPLGGNRVTTTRNLLNLLIVWLLTGLWHGNTWTFIVWGLFNFLLIMIEKYMINPKTNFIKKPSILNHLYSLIMINISWVFFRSSSITFAFQYIKKMFSFNFDKTNALHALSFIQNAPLVWILSALLCTPLFKNIYLRIKKVSNINFRNAIILSILIIFFITAMAFVVSSNYTSFIYEQF